MRALPNGVVTKRDAIRLLGALDGRESAELKPWDLDDFSSSPHPDPAIERCRKRVLFELLDLLSAEDTSQRCRITPLIDELIVDLRRSIEMTNEPDPMIARPLPK